MATVEEQLSVGTLLPHRADEALCVRVAVGAARRDQGYLDALVSEDGIEGGGEFRVPLADQVAEVGGAVTQWPEQLPGLGSITGAPGVTTTALAVAAQWPQRVDGGVRPVVVEADSSGGDLMVRCALPATPSLLDIAAAVGKPYPGSLLGAVHELSFGCRAVVAVPGRSPCGAAVRLLADEPGQRVLLGDDKDRGTVLLDVGRINDDVEPLLKEAERVALVARGEAESLTHVSAYVAEAQVSARRLTLTVVGPCPYSADEIMASVDIARVHFLPWDARTVAGMTRPGDGRLGTARFRRRPLLAAAMALARHLAGPEQNGTTARGGEQPKSENRTAPGHPPDSEETAS